MPVTNSFFIEDIFQKRPNALYLKGATNYCSPFVSVLGIALAFSSRHDLSEKLW